MEKNIILQKAISILCSSVGDLFTGRPHSLTAIGFPLALMTVREEFQKATPETKGRIAEVIEAVKTILLFEAETSGIPMDELGEIDEAFSLSEPEPEPEPEPEQEAEQSVFCASAEEAGLPKVLQDFVRANPGVKVCKVTVE